MEKQKITVAFRISADVAEMLQNRVPEEKLNDFIEEAIHGRFAMMEQEEFLREMVISNKARDEELELIDAGLELDAIAGSDDLLDDIEILELDEIL